MKLALVGGHERDGDAVLALRHDAAVVLDRDAAALALRATVAVEADPQAAQRSIDVLRVRRRAAAAAG